MKTFEISEETLDYVLGLKNTQRLIYFVSIIQKYYPAVEEGSEEFNNLLNAYEATFILEKFYRNNAVVNKYFTPVYTMSGLMRDLTNDLYLTTDSLISH